MDPSRYARAFGVQSESNKATVTRVASNEIVFRRAVDTYRRDMTSKMTSIHREQKKLRRNMKGYRRKLREAQNLPMKKRKPFKIGWIAYDSETSFYDLPTAKDKTNADSDSKQFNSTKLQAQVDVFLKSVDEHIHNMSLKKHEVVESDDDKELFYDKNGRRRFLFGSGGIGISSDALKGLELELEGYHFHDDDLFSDTSSEGEGGHDSERKAARHDSRKKRVMELLRLNSAYFTPIDFKDHDIDPNTNEGVVGNSTNESENANQMNPNSENIQSTDNNGNLTVLPSIISTDTEIKPEERKTPLTLSNAISTVVQAVKDKNEIESVLGQNRNQSQAFELRRSNKVNFGDLIKFKHGVNTKKLFSMVDQLASRFSVPSKENENNLENKRPQGPINPRANHSLEPINESGSKSSVFYSMKYGHGKDARSLEKDEYRSRMGASPVGGDRTGGYQTNAHNFDERLNGDTRLSLNIDRLPVDQHDMVDGTRTRSERLDRKNELPFLQVSSPASLTRQSNTDAKESRISENGVTPVNPQSFLDNEDSVKKRRSSILDASNYVSNLRRRTMIQEHDKLFGIKNDAERFGPRRMPAALRKDHGISEHQRKADDKKITWSSALGQMKLVHTLQDLTHFI